MSFLGWIKNTLSLTKNAIYPKVPTPIAPNTYLAHQLSTRVITLLIQKLKEKKIYSEDENILVVWSYDNSFNLDNDVFVFITTHRLVKIQKNNVFAINRIDIMNVSHQQSTCVRWDHIQCVMKNYYIDTFGIFNCGACAYFVNYLNSHKITANLSNSTKMHILNEFAKDDMSTDAESSSTDTSSQPIVY